MQEYAEQSVNSSALVFTTLSIALWLAYGVQYSRIQRMRIRGGGTDGGNLVPAGLPLILFMQTLIFVAQLVCFYNAVAFSKISRDTEFQYDEFVMSLQWFPGVCAGGRTVEHQMCNVTAKKNHWTIQSLMTDETRCASISYFNRHLKSLNKEKLRELWPSYMNSFSDEKLWDEEWLEHGTCCKGHHEVNSVLKYFDKAIQLYEMIAIDSTLNTSGINPSTTKRLSLNELAQALDKVNGHTAVILCRKAGQVLTEIQICFDNDFNLKDCTWQPPRIWEKNRSENHPQDSLTKCGEKFWYYPTSLPPEGDAVIRQTRLEALFGNVRWLRKIIS